MAEMQQKMERLVSVVKADRQKLLEQIQGLESKLEAEASKTNEGRNKEKEKE